MPEDHKKIALDLYGLNFQKLVRNHVDSGTKPKSSGKTASVHND